MAGQERGTDALTRKRVSVVRDFCEEQMVCRRIRDAAKKHYNFLYQERSPYAEAAILAEIPNSIRKETILYIHRDAIQRVGLFLGGKQPDWFCAFAVRLLEPQVVMAGEDIIMPTEATQKIFFVYEGLCEGYVYQERTMTQELGWKHSTPKRPKQHHEDDFDYNRIRAVYGVGCLFGAETSLPRSSSGPELPHNLAVRASDDGPSFLYVLRQQMVMEVSVFQNELGVCLQNAVADAVYLQYISRHTERRAERRKAELKKKKEDLIAKNAAKMGKIPYDEADKRSNEAGTGIVPELPESAIPKQEDTEQGKGVAVNPQKIPESVDEEEETRQKKGPSSPKSEATSTSL
eukprot:gnl/MRDRNA2_/MRDRNA2_19380_c0_seq1.p1 gnl/MRDRNA2_/MRDRNA2_19380_c0~~gnl/MRDRNA2_/MRDRNA2_19380_c0_seq1.p1  ORF type:complete len:365 (-),score=72.01 gnl/MRDRNA2_/MRDRNA2_19380_c0_seq1:85-1125(-)